MENNLTLGNRIVEAMSKLSIDEWKFSVMNSFQDYKDLIYDDEARNEPWLHFLDLVALQWGYFGDLDIYIDTMEKRLAEFMVQTTTKEEANIFIKSVGDFKENHEIEIEQMKKEWGVE